MREYFISFHSSRCCLHTASPLPFPALPILFLPTPSPPCQPVITNDATRHHYARGVPPGHPIIEKFLGIPLYTGGLKGVDL